MRKSKQRSRVRARDLVCYWSVCKLGMTMVDVARKLDVTSAAVSFESTRRWPQGRNASRAAAFRCSRQERDREFARCVRTLPKENSRRFEAILVTQYGRTHTHQPI